MSDTRIENHFGEAKKPHTKIKHLILERLLQLSLSIANILSNSRMYQKTTYIYVDLFSGPGIFYDKSPGSPMIAYDTMFKHVNYEKNNFSNFQIMAIDKSEDNINSLNDLINKKYIEDNTRNLIRFYSYKGDWSTYTDKIKNHLNESKWGFIFVDPFSTELDITLLENTLKDIARFKDILIFFNYNTLARQKGRNCSNDRQRVSTVIGSSDKESPNDNKTFYESFEDSIKTRLSNIKTFVKGVSFPTTKEGALIKGDYFYLVFATNTLILVDGFLRTYEEALIKFSSYNSQIFVPGLLDLKNEIMEIIQNASNKQVTLFELYDRLTDKFLSWKKSIEQGDQIPTLRNIINTINELKSLDNVKIVCVPDYLYVRGKKIQGNINSNKIKSTQDLKSIYILLGSNSY